MPTGHRTKGPRARLARAVLVLAGAGSLFASPADAFAMGEEQVNRGFAAVGPSLLIPVSDDFENNYDPSLGLAIEGGYLVGLGPSFVVAPTGAFRYVSLADDLDGFGVEVRSWVWQLLAGAKAGWAGRGLFIYGEGAIGLNTVQFEVCTTFGCSDDDETDFMVRFGGGADFSVWRFLAVGGSAAIPIVFSDDSSAYTENTIGFELTAYAKFLFPEGPTR